MGRLWEDGTLIDALTSSLAALAALRSKKREAAAAARGVAAQVRSIYI